MTRKHVVEPGECLTTIAASHGFSDWRVLHDHPDNAALREKRPDPNLLFLGDVVVIPDRETKEIEVDSGSVHRFRCKRGGRRLHVHLIDRDRASLAGKPYKVLVDDALHDEGTTSASGEIDVLVPIDARRARIEAGDHGWDLAVGHLNPIKHTPDEGSSGIKARLHNLGYDVGSIDGPFGPEVRATMRWFQRDHGLDPTGTLDDATRDQILRAHRS